MTTLWAVSLNSSHGEIAYGPFYERPTADGFAAFISDEVDPATVVPYRGGDDLHDPVAELLAWRRMHEAFCSEQRVAELEIRLDEARHKEEVAWKHASTPRHALPYVPTGPSGQPSKEVSG